MNQMHDHDCNCGECETIPERYARDKEAERTHSIYADRVHAGYCYECQVWL